LISTRTSSAIVLCAAAAIILRSGGMIWAADEPKPVRFDPAYVANLARDPALTYHGSVATVLLDTSCYDCHGTTEKKKPEYLRFATFQESPIWNEKDFHRNAFLALKTPRAEAMGRLLGIKNVAESTQCLNCHSGHHKIEEVKDAAPKLTAPIPTLADQGVSCQACHGPAKKYLELHKDDTAWWTKSRDAKYGDGLLDVRHPMTRAQICYSCHLGSSQEGKVLTHDMYAAGHPPLQNAEVETFVKGMPYHGHPLKTKAQAAAQLQGIAQEFKLADLYKGWYKPGSDNYYYYRTRSVLTSSLVSLRMQLQLVMDEAAWNGTGGDGDQRKPAWPELSFYNCAACHHELETDRRRQSNLSTASLGRPLLRRWPTVLYEVVALTSPYKTVSGDGLFADMADKKVAVPADLLRTLDQEFSASPFGRPDEVNAIGKSVADRITEQINALNDGTIDRGAALTFLKNIGVVGASRALEFEEARQLWMAGLTIIEELKDAPGAKAGEQQVLESVESTLKGWSDRLGGKLGTRGSAANLGAPAAGPAIAPAGNPAAGPYDAGLLKAGFQALEAAAAHDPGAFSASMETLKGEMAKIVPEGK
jgi:hypothetical protein